MIFYHVIAQFSLTPVRFIIDFHIQELLEYILYTIYEYIFL